jgi:ribosomal subunit interface protein
MEIVVRGRNVEVPEHYRQHVADKLRRAERYDHKIIRIDVELYHERNRRQANSCQRVEITCWSRGPVIRSEASAPDFYTALDAAAAKLQTRLRRAADRRRVHHGTRTPTSVAAVTGRAANATGEPLAGLATAVLDPPGEGADRAQEPGAAAVHDDDHTPGRIVREKEHPAKPMSVDQALFEMELVGHDFYLFNDVDTGRASVVYRRRGYDYGIIRLGG